MQCDRCRHAAVIFQPYSGLHLCRKHFALDVEAKAKRAIRTHSWLKSGDHVAVDLSAGSGSRALLHFLRELTGRRRDITLSAIVIDEGIAGYRDPAGVVAVAAELGVPCITASFAGEYGTTLDAMVQENGGTAACQYCRVLKQTLLNRVALKNGASRIALGSSLNDVAESVLCDVLAGDTDHLLSCKSVPEGRVPVIRPFMYITGPEVARYAELKFGLLGEPVCPHATGALRGSADAFLDEYTQRHPSARYSLVRLGERIERAGRSVQDRVRRCGRCGEPCGDTCRSCRILDEVACHAQ